MKTLRILCLALATVFMATSSLLAQDTPGSKDHPLFTRMPGYFIESYRQADFDSFEFHKKGGGVIAVEGKLTVLGYRPNDGVKVPSPLQIARNYQNAATRIGGVVLFEEVASGGGITSIKLVRGTDEIWVEVGIGDSGNNYHVTIVEKGGMKQDVLANADTWKSDITSTGHAAIYGIYFDTNKSEVKPESKTALDEIAKLLGKNPTLKIFVVGHTDATGAADANIKLSQARAESVIRALTGRYGISPARLRGQGVGPFAPVASNDTEEGRAKNRRVELVKQ